RPGNFHPEQETRDLCRLRGKHSKEHGRTYFSWVNKGWKRDDGWSDLLLSEKASTVTMAGAAYQLYFLNTHKRRQRHSFHVLIAQYRHRPSLCIVGLPWI